MTVEKWKEILDNIIKFWYEHMAFEILMRKLVPGTSVSQPNNLVENHLSSNLVALNIRDSSHSHSTKRKYTVSENTEVTPKIKTYRCGICAEVLKDNPTIYFQYCICCDLCQVWYHFHCVGIKEQEEPSKDQEWICSTCTSL